MQLRPYQQLAVNAILEDLKRPGNSICVAATGAGKSVIIAEVARQLNSKILILVPSVEILRQNFDKISLFFPREDIGIFSASANEKTIKKITLAMIQSCCKKPELFVDFDLVLVDECHNIPVRNMESMYMSFFNSINDLRSTQ